MWEEGHSGPVVHALDCISSSLGFSQWVSAFFLGQDTYSHTTSCHLGLQVDTGC